MLTWGEAFGKVESAEIRWDFLLTEVVILFHVYKIVNMKEKIGWKWTCGKFRDKPCHTVIVQKGLNRFSFRYFLLNLNFFSICFYFFCSPLSLPSSLNNSLQPLKCVISFKQRKNRHFKDMTSYLITTLHGHNWTWTIGHRQQACSWDWFYVSVCSLLVLHTGYSWACQMTDLKMFFFFSFFFHFGDIRSLDPQNVWSPH